jgi:predicted ATPase/DNA-binding CsgD family transcriptional regulator
VSGLIGREREVSQLGELVRTEGVRLVTVTGPGGVGKTRVALAMSEAVQPDFDGGVVTVPLGAVSRADLLFPTIAGAVGVRTPKGDALVGLQGQLGNAELLLVLDDVEHLAPAALRLVELLDACPRLKVVSTSRTRLRLSPEREFPLAPLELPDCVTLFVERARAVRPDLDTSETGLCEIELLCRSLDGLPLAIELAAARAKLLSPEALRTRLGDRLALLGGGASDLPARQQTLRATLDWSFGLLGDEERRVLPRLATFAGGFTLEAVEAVCAASIDALATLVDNSLVQASGDRFSMLETVRAYAEEQLASGNEETEVRRRHAAFFLDRAEDAAPRLAGEEHATWSELLESEHANLRAALDFALRTGDDASALRFGAALWRFWLERGYFAEGRAWLRQALSRDGDPELRARALTGASVLAHYAGDYEAAEALCRESIDLNEARGDEPGRAAALEALALAVRTRGDFAGAVPLFEQALETFRAIGDDTGVARTLDRLGIAVWFTGNDDRAEALVAESLAAFRRLGDRAGIGLVSTDLGLLALSRGDFRKAEPLLMQGLALSQELADRWNVAKALYGLGDAARTAGDLGLAASRYDDGLTLTVEYGFPWFTALFLERLAGLCIDGGGSEQAAELFGAAETVRQEIGAPMPPYFGAIYDADLSALRGRLEAPAIETAWARGSTLTLELVGESAHAVRSSLGGPEKDGLTGREVEVLELVAQGLTDGAIAKRLFVSPRTVHAHLRSIYRKLDVGTRSAATRYAVERGLVQDR